MSQQNKNIQEKIKEFREKFVLKGSVIQNAENLESWLSSTLSSVDKEVREATFKEVENRIKILQEELKPLTDEYDIEYKIWFEGNKAPHREKLLKEYESGAKGLRLYALQIKIVELERLMKSWLP